MTVQTFLRRLLLGTIILAMATLIGGCAAVGGAPIDARYREFVEP